jgi:hypothetical protein
VSAVVRCDGPTCDQTVDPDSGTRMSWLSANRGMARFDFHSPACLVEWASEQPDPTTRVRPCAGCGSTDHTTTEHATTVVDGR